jgi:CDP-diacylglycerol--glycerol-3-phosphate 3-phosphatidyltransferase
MAISDIVDGRLARQLGVVSPMGVFLDTTSDKIFVTAAMIPMIERGLWPGWMVLLIILREFAVSGLRSYAASQGVVIAARAWGKQKLTFQVMALIWCLLATAAAGVSWIPMPLAWLLSIWPLILWLALGWTIGSGLEYFWNARKLLGSSITRINREAEAPPDPFQPPPGEPSTRSAGMPPISNSEQKAKVVK